jgi:hypothetical protein
VIIGVIVCVTEQNGDEVTGHPSIFPGVTVAAVMSSVSGSVAM